jgi:hypothetical protein
MTRRPEWVAEWLAEREIDRRVRDLCEARGYRFAPWECHPADAPDELPPGLRLS